MEVKYIVQRYQRYAIYEPAEGGYYYDGLWADEHYSKYAQKAEAISALLKLVTESNEALSNLPQARGYLILDPSGTKAYSINHKYIGDGCEFYVEPINRRGRHSKGYVPYC